MFCDNGYDYIAGTTEYSCRGGKLLSPSLSCQPRGCVLPSSISEYTSFQYIINEVSRKLDKGNILNNCYPGLYLKSGQSCRVGCVGDGFIPQDVEQPYGSVTCKASILKYPSESVGCKSLFCTLPLKLGNEIQNITRFGV